MKRFTLHPRPAAVVPLATFESCNDPKVTTPADSKYALLDIGPPHAGRPPFDHDTALAPVDASVKGWPAAGMTQGRSIEVRLRRGDLDDAAKLELRTSDPSKLTAGPLAAGRAAVVTLSSPPPGPEAPQAAPHLVRVEATWNGQVVAGLAVYVHPPLAVKLHVHRVVPVKGAARGKPGVFPPIGPALEHTNAIWTQAGVEMQLAGDTPLEVPVDHAPAFMNDDDERLAFQRGIVGVVNLFLSDRHENPDLTGTLGHTVGAHILERPEFGPPFLTLYGRAPAPRDKFSYWADDPGRFSVTLGHELGHFWDLDHAVFRDEGEKLQWVGVQRLLMSPVQPSGSLIPCGYGESNHAGVLLQGALRARESIIKHGFAARAAAVTPAEQPAARAEARPAPLARLACARRVCPPPGEAHA